MKLCSIASGSSGNCIFAGTDSTSLVIDVGISGKRVENGLNEIGHTMREADGILITHEHSDHISGLGVVARRYGVPIYATKGTIGAIQACKSIGEVPKGLFREIEPDVDFTIGDISITPVPISHDAAMPTAFVLRQGKKSMAVMTDLGKFDHYIIGKLQNLDVLLLEANHDIRMLETGPYPYYLKRRIMGNSGHLSNDCAGRLLGEILHDGFKKAVLGHLSQENNYADLAYETVKLEITEGENAYQGTDFDIAVADRREMSETVYI